MGPERSLRPLVGLSECDGAGAEAGLAGDWGRIWLSEGGVFGIQAAHGRFFCQDVDHRTLLVLLSC